MIPAAEVILLMPQDVAPLRFRQGGGQVDLGPEQAHDERARAIKKQTTNTDEDSSPAAIPNSQRGDSKTGSSSQRS